MRKVFRDRTARISATSIFLLASVCSPHTGTTTLYAQTSVNFSDPTLTAETTQVKAVHITELRWWVDTFRVDCGLSAYTFTDSTVTTGSTMAKAVHITELRTALGEAYSACGTSAPTYTDTPLSSGSTVIKAVHIEELRAAVEALAAEVYPLRGTSYTLDTTTAEIYIGHASSIAIGHDNNPVIAYYDPLAWLDANLAMYVCTSTSCSSGTSHTIDSGSDHVQPTQHALVIGSDGNPIIAYQDTTNQSLKVHVCADTACTSGTTRSGDPDGNSGGTASIAIGSDGNPVLAYYDGDAKELKIYMCADTTCSSGTERSVNQENSTEFGWASSIAIGSDGNPVVSYYDRDNGKLKLFVCSDTSCSNGLERTLDSTGSPGFQGSSLVIGNDNSPIIAYHKYPTVDPNEELKLYRCADVTCSSGTATLLYSGYGRWPSLAIGSENNPMISYIGGGGRQQLAVCTDATCTGAIAKTLNSVRTAGSSIAIGTDNNPIISYFDYQSGDLKVYACSTTKC